MHIFPETPLERACALAAQMPSDWRDLPPGEALRWLRSCLHMTQRQLAGAAGIHQSLVVRIERGADCKVSTLERLLRAAGIYTLKTN